MQMQAEEFHGAFQEHVAAASGLRAGIQMHGPGRPPARRRQSGGRRTRLQRLLSSEQDFTAEDYDMLLELDSRNRPRNTEHAHNIEALLSRMPVSKRPATAEKMQCTVCLEDMGPGAEVRALPCMHIFHAKCIDRWLRMPGVPKCPIDQQAVEI